MGMSGSDPVAEITWSQVLAVRVRRHMLEQRGSRDDLIPLARMLCGFHGQILSAAEQTAAARLDGLKPGDFEQALWEDRTLYKTWAMRGTLHILPSDQFAIWIAALSQLPRADDSASWRKYFATSTDMVDDMIRATDIALKDEIHTRESLAAAVAMIAKRPDLEERLMGSWGLFLKPSARLGHVCFAPSEGSRVRFTHPITWLPLVEDIDPEEGLRIALRQYLHTYGPTNRREFMRWFGVIKASLGDRLLSQIADETSTVRISGEAASYRVLTADVEELCAAVPSTTVRLLPGFDQYVVNANRGIGAILPQEHSTDVYRAQGWISPTIVVGGQIVGTWSHDLKSADMKCQIRPFSPLDGSTTRLIETEAERWAGYFGRPLTIQWA